MRLQNTLTGEVEDLAPVVPGQIGIYVCGVTPYDSAHVGHAMSLIVYDVLVRYLRWRGLTVTFVSNYTDVDDKLIERGAALGLDPLELANRNIAQWEDEQQRLGLLKPDVRPRVTEHIDEIKAMIEEIVAHGFGYVTPSGDVYFRVRAKADYGKLSHRNIPSAAAEMLPFGRRDDLRTGTRFEPGEEKEFPLDFALWKAAKPGEPAWDSPCGIAGRGRPGWHIECSAMSRRYLGERFDIHGGGLDLIFPHHENEIAQAEAAAHAVGSPEHPVFARLWMHNGMVQRDGEKMSKSVGNVVGVQEALERWSPDAIRLYVLNSHYRAATNLTDEAMRAAMAGVERLVGALARDRGEPTHTTAQVTQYEARFVTEMEDDLGTPRALAVLFDMARDINRLADAGAAVGPLQDKLHELTGVLGLALTGEAARADDAEIELLLVERASARAAKNFALADQIRADLEAAGIVIEDTPQGARWSVRR